MFVGMRELLVTPGGIQIVGRRRDFTRRYSAQVVALRSAARSATESVDCPVLFNAVTVSLEQLEDEVSSRLESAQTTAEVDACDDLVNALAAQIQSQFVRFALEAFPLDLAPPEKRRRRFWNRVQTSGTDR